MSVLDYIVPSGFQSDVQSTFAPKQFNLLQAGEFTPGRSDQGDYDRYVDLINQGYQITPEAYEFLTADKNTRKAMERSADDSTYNYGSMLNPESEFFAFYKPGELDDFTGNIFGGQTLAQGFQRAGVMDYDPSMAKTAKLSTLRALDPGSYSSQISTRRGSLADKLTAARQRAQATGGGFAGYGGRGVGEEIAEAQYETGVQDVYGQVGAQRGQAMKTLQDQLSDYGTLISQQKGG